MRYHNFSLIVLCLGLLAMAGLDNVNAQEWPLVKQEAKPGTRWWWLGSAVDSANLTYNLETYAKAGIGAVEITPIYGVQGHVGCVCWGMLRLKVSAWASKSI